MKTQKTTPILVVGAGKIGTVISELLANSGDYLVTLADANSQLLSQTPSQTPSHPHITYHHLDVRDKATLVDVMTKHFAVLCACPFDITRDVALAAADAHIHYFDLTEDVECTRLVKSLAQKADHAFIPQCGLAPGFITIATQALIEKFDTLRDVNMRVGALPCYPSNTLKYNLTRSTEGLINEYCNPCEAIVNSQFTEVPPLEEIETFSLDGVTYEAFNTSGGLGTLCETLNGKVENLNYRTVRYPGHRDLMKLLLHDLRLKNRQNVLKEIFEASLPVTYQDVVLVFIKVSGIRDGHLIEESYMNKVYHQDVHGQHRSGIQITTASSVCAVLDLLREGKIPNRGLVKQEDIPFEMFIQNRFGRYYDTAQQEPHLQDAS